MNVFTNLKTATFIVVLWAGVAQAQFSILSTGNFFAKENALVYSNENTINDGVISFEKGSKLVVDKNFVNNSANAIALPGLVTPAFFMAQATLQVGSGNASSGVAQTLSFKDTAGIAYPTTSNTTGFNQVLNLLVNKTGGAVSVDKGMLHLTSLDPVADGKSTLKIQSATTLNAADRITLRSSSVANTALVDVSNPSASVTNIVAERFIPAKRVYRLLTPTTTGGSINANWQEGQVNTGFGTISTIAGNVDNRPGYGTHITGALVANSAGLDPQPSGAKSLFKFNNTTNLWQKVTNTITETATAGTSYRILVRGSRSVNLASNSSPASNTILRTKGSLVFGDNITQSATATAAGQRKSFSNPYHSIVDVTTSNLTNVKTQGLVVWDPNLGASGSWTVVDLVANTATGGSVMRKYLQPGQAFFLEALSASAMSIKFNEDTRITNQNLVNVFDNGPLNRIDARLYSLESHQNGGNALAGIFIDFEQNGNNNYDIKDIGANDNIDETLSSITDNNLVASWQTRNTPLDNEVVNLEVTRYRDQSYVLRLHLDQFLGKNAFLKDNFTKTETLIEPNQVLNYSYTVDSQVSNSVAANRFQIIFKNNSSNENNLVSSFVLYPNPSNGNGFNIATNGISGEDVEVKIVNMLGQIVSKHSMNVPTDGLVSINDAGLAEGVYSVDLRVIKSNKNFQSKLIIKN